MLSKTIGSGRKSSNLYFQKIIFYFYPLQRYRRICIWETLRYPGYLCCKNMVIFLAAIENALANNKISERALLTLVSDSNHRSPPLLHMTRLLSVTITPTHVGRPISSAWTAHFDTMSHYLHLSSS